MQKHPPFGGDGTVAVPARRLHASSADVGEGVVSQGTAVQVADVEPGQVRHRGQQPRIGRHRQVPSRRPTGTQQADQLSRRELVDVREVLEIGVECLPRARSNPDWQRTHFDLR
nr:hypothetical protein [Ornithinimicrobium sp. HY1745]